MSDHHARLRLLCKLVNKGKRQAARRLQDHILNSYSGGLCALLEGIVPKSRLDQPKPLAPEELDKMVRSIRPTRRISGRAVAIAQKKSNGSRRIVLSPDWKVRCAQRLVGHALSCWNLTNPADYNYKGRGTHAAVAEVVRLIQEEGLRSFVLFDLANFFSSVKPTHLKGRLPLPNQVMKHTLFYNSSVILFHSGLSAAEAEAARHSLSAGARLSGIVAAMLLGWELRELSGAKGTVAYVDDVVIGGCDPAGAKNLAETLKDRFANHPGGPLSFKYVKVVDAYEGFPFLGYFIRLCSQNDKDVVLVKPSHEAKQKLRRNLFKKLGDLGAGASFDQLLQRAQQYCVHWRKSFPVWVPSESAIADLEDEVLCLVGDFAGGLIQKHPPLLHAITGSTD